MQNKSKKLSKYNNSEDAGYLLPLCAIIFGYIVSFRGLSFNIDSLFDEGFLYVFVQDALNGHIDGSTQWANMMVAFLPQSICASVLAMRKIGWLVSVISAIIFFLITQRATETVKEKIFYFILVLFMMLPCMGGIMMHYNEISQFMLIISCATLYRLCTGENKYKNIIWAILTGLLITFALFAILPSAVIIGGCSVLLVLICYWNQKNDMLLYLTGGIMGIGLALLVVQLCVADLSTIYERMTATAQTITTLNRGYDPISFAVKILLFLRDFSFCVFVIIGVYAFSKWITGWSKWLAFGVYAVALWLYSRYQVKPNLTLPMLMSMLWVVPIYAYAQEKGSSMNIKNVFSFDNVFILFLIAFPLLASIGTNVYLGGKMAYFLVPWALLMLKLKNIQHDTLFRNAGLLVISLILILSFRGKLGSFDYHSPQVQSGGFAGLHMTEAQYQHFTLVDSIVSQYDFKRNESVVFSTQLSSVTMSYIEGVPYGNYFQPMDFFANSDTGKEKPDFIFLCKYDIDVAGETIRKMNWGWPDEFDEYYIGTPETVVTGYPTERWLYCRKVK